MKIKRSNLIRIFNMALKSQKEMDLVNLSGFPSTMSNIIEDAIEKLSKDTYWIEVVE